MRRPGTILPLVYDILFGVEAAARSFADYLRGGAFWLGVTGLARGQDRVRHRLRLVPSGEETAH